MAPPLRKIGKRRRVIGQIELPMPNRPPPPPQKDCIVRAQRKNVVRNRRKKRKWAHRRRSLLEEEAAGNGRREQKRFNLITYRFPYKVSFLDWGPFPKKTQQPPTVFRGTGPFFLFLEQVFLPGSESFSPSCWFSPAVFWRWDPASLSSSSWCNVKEQKCTTREPHAGTTTGQGIAKLFYI